MKRKRHTPEQIIRKLREAEGLLEERMVKAIIERDSGRSLDPSSAPKDWLESFARQTQGTYLVAVGPHEDAECEIPASGVVPMERD